MQITKMSLGFTFEDISVDDRGYLHFRGTALDEGVWSDMYGHTAFWSRDVIHAGMDGFRGKAITCEHDAAVGIILDLIKTETGFKSDGIITSQRTRKLVEDGLLKGLSVTTEAYVDPVRQIVLEMVNQHDISVVSNPACKVCMLENTWIGNMTNKEIEQTVVDVDIAASAATTTDVDVEVVNAELSAPDTTEPVVTDNSEIEALNMRLSAYEAHLDELKKSNDDKEITIAELSAEVSVLRAQNESLVGKQRDELVNAILSADPNADKTILDKTSTDALGAYLQTVMRLSARRDVTTLPKGLKINEAPKQEPIAKNSIDSTSMMIGYLKGKQ